MIFSAAPNFERRGVIAGFVLSLGAGLRPAVTKGVLFAQDTLYRPSLAPQLPLAPASTQSWLYYNSASGFYWASSPTHADDAFLGWVVTDSTSVILVSVQQLGSGETAGLISSTGSTLQPGGATGAEIQDVEIIAAVYRYTEPDASGARQVISEIIYRPPDDSVIAVHAYLEAPAAVYGTGVAGLAIAGSAIASSSAGTQDLGRYGSAAYESLVDGTVKVILGAVPEPKEEQSWRVYLCACTATVEKPLYTVSSETPTPNIVFTVKPYAGLAVGVEWCPNPTMLSVVPEYEFRSSQWFHRVTVVWVDPTYAAYPDRVALYSGCHVILEDPEGNREDKGFVAAGIQTWTSAWRPCPTSPQAWKVWLPGSDRQNRLNSISTWVTPGMGLYISSPASVPNVTGFSISYAYEEDQWGRRALVLTMNFTRPDDPQWCYFDLWAMGPSGVWENYGWWVDKVRIYQLPSVSYVWDFAAVAYDVNGKNRDGLAMVAVPGTWPDGTPTYSRIILPPAEAEPIANFTADYQYRINADGQRVMVIWPTFTKPDDPTWAALKFDVVINGGSVVTLGYPATSGEEHQVSDFPKSIESWAFYAYSRDVNGKISSTGVRYPASGWVSVGPPPEGSSGQEFTSLVTGQSASLTSGQDAQGVEIFGYAGAYTPPSTASDPTFGGVALIAENQTTGWRNELANKGPEDATFNTSKWPMANGETWTVWFVSVDVNGNRNSIVAGVTPRIVGLVVGASATGTLKANRLKTETMSTELSVYNEKLRVTPSSIGSDKVSTILTGQVTAGLFFGHSLICGLNNIYTEINNQLGADMEPTGVLVMNQDGSMPVFVQPGNLQIRETDSWLTPRVWLGYTATSDTALILYNSGAKAWVKATSASGYIALGSLQQVILSSSGGLTIDSTQAIDLSRNFYANEVYANGAKVITSDRHILCRAIDPISGSYQYYGQDVVRTMLTSCTLLAKSIGLRVTKDGNGFVTDVHLQANGSDVTTVDLGYTFSATGGYLQFVGGACVASG